MIIRPYERHFGFRIFQPVAVEPDFDHPRAQGQSLIGTFIEEVLVGQIGGLVGTAHPTNLIALSQP